MQAQNDTETVTTLKDREDVLSSAGINDHENRAESENNDGVYRDDDIRFQEQ